MIDKLEQYGYKGLEIKGITIHNTTRSLGAREEFKLLENGLESGGCHFLIDENEIIEVMPLDWCAYHTGKGKDWGNDYTIAIEICRSQSDFGLYMRAQNNAIKFIKKLMKTYKLTNADVYFHIDFNKTTYCPHKILEIYKSKKNFIKEVLKK